MKREYIYVNHRLGGPYWEKLCPRSWVRPRAVLRPRAQFLPTRTDLGRWITFLFFSYWDLSFRKIILQPPINSPKNCYWEKTTLQRMISRDSPHSSRRWQQQLKNTHLFSLLSVNKFKRFLLNVLIKHMVNASWCIAESWMHSGDSGLLSSQQLTTRGITNSLLTSSACSKGIWGAIALLNIIRRIF